MSAQDSGVRPDGRESADHREESADERADRNWSEILQELRVSQTGTQIIAGFLLAVAFQPRFADLDTVQSITYGALVGVATISTALSVSAVALHRGTFRRHEKPITVRIGSRLLAIEVTSVAILAVGVAFFLFDVAFGRIAGVIAGAAATMLVGGLTLVLPRRARAIGRRTLQD